MENFSPRNPSYSLIKIPMFQTNIISYGNKIEQRLAKNSIVQWKLQLNFKVLTREQSNYIVNFFIARKGKFDAFKWTNPEDSVEYTVRFEEDMMNIEYFSYLLYTLNQVNLIEVSA